MSAVIGALRGVLSLDSAAFETGAKRSKAAMGDLERRMVRLGGKFEAVGRKMTVGLTLPMAGAAAVAVKSSLKVIDAQAKMAQSFGTTVKSLQVLERAADLSGVSMGEVQQATIQLTKRLSQAAGGTGAAAKALTRLHLNAQQLQRLPLDERLAKIQAALAQYVPEAERAAVASDLFGSRAGLIFTRIDGSALRIATDDIERFGVAVSEVDAEQIERTNDAISRLGLVGRGVSNQLAVGLAPTLEWLSDQAADAAEWFNGLSDRTKQFISVGAALTAAVGPAAIGLGLMLKVVAPLGAALTGVVTAVALAPVKFIAAAKAAVALEIALGATSTKAALAGVAIKGLTRGLKLLRLAALATGIGALVGVAAGIYQGFQQSKEAAENFETAIRDLASAHDVLNTATETFYSNMSAKNAEAMRRAAEAARDTTREALEAAKAELEAAKFTGVIGSVFMQSGRISEAQRAVRELSAALAEAEARLDAATVAAELTATETGNAAENAATAAENSNALAGGLAAASGQASALSSYLASVPGAIASAQTTIAGLKAGMAVLSSGGGEAAANVAKYRAELEASAGPLGELHEGQREGVQRTIDLQVQLYAQEQQLRGEYQKQLTALNKVKSSGGAASKSAMASLQKEIKERRELLGVTEAQWKKLEAIRLVQQRLGKDAQGYSKAQISGLADQLIELDAAEEATRRIADQQERWAENITRTAFEGGSLTDTIEGMLRDIQFQFAHTKIVLPIVGQITGFLALDRLSLGGGGGQAVGGSAGGGFPGFLGGISNILGVGGTGLAGLAGSGGILGGLGGLASGFGGILSGGGLGASFANVGGLITGASGFTAGAIGAALPAIGVIIAGAAFLKKAFSRKFAYSALEGTIGADGFDGYARDHFKGGLFRSDKDVRKALDYDLKTGLSNQAKGLTEGLLGMSEALGRGRDALKDYKGHFVSILTSGRSQEQIQKDLARGFETASNQMSELILGTSKWSKAGESATETLTRLSTSLLQVNDAFDLLGLSGFKKSLQGADMASGLVDDFGGAEAMTNAVSAYWTGFYSDAERQETTIRRLSAEFKKLGLAMPQSREEFRSLVEGIDRTSASGRKLYADLLKLSGGLGQVLDPRAGISQGVAKQLEAIGKTVADQIEVSRSMAADARASAELWHRTAAKLRDFQDGLLNSGLSGASSAQTAAALRGRYLSALERARGGDTDAAAELPGLAREYLQSARDSAGSALEFNRIAAQVQAEIHQMTALADAAGDAEERLADLLDEQTSVLTELGEYLQTANASSKKFGEDVAQYQDRLKALGADIVEASKNPGIAEVSPTGSMSKLFGALTGGLSGVKAPMNSLTSMLGKLRDAVNADRRERNRNAKIAGLQVKGGDAAAAAKRPQEIADKFNALREKYGVSLHGQKRSISVNKDGQLVTSFDYYGGTPSKLAAFKKALKDEFGTASFGNVVSSANSKASKAAVQAESLRKQIRSMGAIPQFAGGGKHLGGWRIVGERGWELENTGPSRVVSHSDSVAMLDNRQVVRSVEGLAKQVAVQGQRMEMMVRKVAQYLEDWDEVGQPEVRV
ncbi:hypothetical protein [Leisingera sp. ANG-S3]|uniref:hypothetical protein n=1 Tax=Leisingera sp. ANG-S3 TaxID=1577899 RepID=UPI000691F4DA|nr:hypothetical protein [Leisingera sp. ANG-S3]